MIRRIPGLLKKATALSNRRYFANEAASVESAGVKAGAATATPNTTTPANAVKNSSGKRNRNGKKRQNRQFKPKVEMGRNNAAAAAAVTADKGTAPSKEATPNKDSNMETVMTRLNDNHPLTMEDRDPRYYLQHLGEDQLDEMYPLFAEDREEMPEEYPTTKRSVVKDAYGHSVEVVTHNPSQKERDLADSGVFFPKDYMYGYTSDTPLVVTTKDALVDYDDKDDLAAGIITNKDGEVIGNKSGTPAGSNGASDVKESAETKPVETEAEQAEEDDLRAMNEDGDYLATTPLVAGGAVQAELDVARGVQQAYARRLRQEHRRMVLGYDARQFANAEPWVDTHRIEAIDARLHALHQERARGELAYALEKDAAAEARRIRAEEDAALAAIREAIGLREGATVDAGATLASEKRSGFRVKGRSLEKLRARRVKSEKAEMGESALDALAVADIPVEQLYAARRRELEKLRQRRYEDYDLGYLLAQSGKRMTGTAGAAGASLYELRHGETETRRRASADEEANPLLGAKRLSKEGAALSEEAKAGLVQELQLFERFGRLTEDEVLGLYAADVQVVTPEMERALQAAEAAPETATGDVSLNRDLFGNKSKVAQAILKTPAAAEPKEDAAFFSVDPDMDALERDASKPLGDTEMGLTKDGQLVVARRRHPAAYPNYARDKKEFMDAFDAALNRGAGGEVSEAEKEEVKKLVVSEAEVAATREAMGLPADVSKKEFAKRYLRRWRQHKSDGETVSELMTGYSVEHPEKMLKDLGVDTEAGIEAYLMDTFKSHRAEESQLIPPDQQETLRLLQESSRVVREAEAKLEVLKKESGVKEGEKPAEGEEKPAESEAKKGEVKEGEGEKPAEEVKEGEEKPAEEVKGEGNAEKPAEEVKEGEEKKEAKPEEKKEEEKEPFSPESNPEDPLKALEALETRFNEAEARAQKLSPFYEDEAADHHPVDALEYSAQVYVHEKDRAMIFRMYRQGVSPQEISQSFGYDEGRVVAILRLMQAREARKKAGIFTEKAVAALEASEDVFQYEYRDFPPANFKRAEKRREVATLPRSLPRFVFLNEEDEEAEIMKQVDRLVQRKRREKQPEIARAGLPVGKSERRRRG